MPAGTQLCNWNDIAGEVTAGTMAWKGAAQSGTNDITFAQFQANVQNDGTNPAGIAATQCPTYNQMIARASTVGSPNAVTAAAAGPRNITGSWAAPSSGVAPTSYDYQYYADGAKLGAQGNTAGLTAPNVGGWATGQLASISVRARNGSAVGPWVDSAQVAVP